MYKESLSNCQRILEDFFDDVNCKREQNQARLNYAECSQKSLVCKMYEILNKHIKKLITQHIDTCKSPYTKGYALN